MLFCDETCLLFDVIGVEGKTEAEDVLLLTLIGEWTLRNLLLSSEFGNRGAAEGIF